MGCAARSHRSPTAISSHSNLLNRRVFILGAALPAAGGHFGMDKACETRRQRRLFDAEMANAKAVNDAASEALVRAADGEAGPPTGDAER